MILTFSLLTLIYVVWQKPFRYVLVALLWAEMSHAIFPSLYELHEDNQRTYSEVWSAFNGNWASIFSVDLELVYDWDSDVETRVSALTRMVAYLPGEFAIRSEAIRGELTALAQAELIAATTLLPGLGAQFLGIAAAGSN